MFAVRKTNERAWQRAGFPAKIFSIPRSSIMPSHGLHNATLGSGPRMPRRTQQRQPRAPRDTRQRVASFAHTCHDLVSEVAGDAHVDAVARRSFHEVLGAVGRVPAGVDSGPDRGDRIGHADACKKEGRKGEAADQPKRNSLPSENIAKREIETPDSPARTTANSRATPSLEESHRACWRQSQQRKASRRCAQLPRRVARG